MVYDRGPFRHYGGHRAEHVRKRYQDRMKNYRSVLDEGMSAAPWVVSRLTEHVADAFLFMTRVSQARDLHDVLTAQSAFVQKKMDMFAGAQRHSPTWLRCRARSSAATPHARNGASAPRT